MLADAPLIAFVGTEDLERAKDFYGRVLGLRLVEEASFAVAFDAAGTMLRVTKVTQCRPAPYTAVGWRVADIVAAVTELAARGICFGTYPGMEQDRQGIWTSPGGHRVAWFKDPDGNTLSVSEFPSS